MTFQRLSGVSAVVYYTVDIFRGAGTSIAPTTATIIVGVVSVVASVTSACLVDRLGRRFLLILSDAVMAVSLAVMAVYFAYKESGKTNCNFSVFCLTCVNANGGWIVSSSVPFNFGLIANICLHLYTHFAL